MGDVKLAVTLIRSVGGRSLEPITLPDKAAEQEAMGRLEASLREEGYHGELLEMAISGFTAALRWYKHDVLGLEDRP